MTRSMRHLLLTLLTLASAFSSAAANSWIQAAAGDTWTYEAQRGRVDAAVDDTYSGWVHVNAFAGFGPLWIWVASNDDRIWYWDGSRAVLLADLGAAAGSTYRLSGLECVDEATLGPVTQTTTRVGTFETRMLAFTGGCADAGVGHVMFARELGIVEWSEQSIIGPVTYQLVEATVGDTTYRQLAQSTRLDVAIGFSSTRARLDVEGTAGEVTVTLRVTNSGTVDKVFHFTSSQRFDIELRSATGEVINLWSADKRFAQVLSDVTLRPGQDMELEGTLRLASLDGTPLTAGTYELAMYLAGADRVGGSTTLVVTTD